MQFTNTYGLSETSTGASLPPSPIPLPINDPLLLGLLKEENVSWQNAVSPIFVNLPSKGVTQSTAKTESHKRKKRTLTEELSWCMPWMRKKKSRRVGGMARM